MQELELAEVLGSASWDSLERTYEVIVAEVEATVTRWAAASQTTDLGEPRLLVEQRRGKKPNNKLFKKEPKDWTRAAQLGFDADDRVTVTRRFASAGGEAKVNLEEIWTRLGDRPVQLLFLHRYDRHGHRYALELRRIAVPIQDDQWLTGVRSWIDPRSADAAELVESYEYDGDALARIDQRHRGLDTWQQEFFISYSPDRQVSRIDGVVTPPPGQDGRFTAYIRSEEVDVDAVKAQVRKSVATAIVSWVDRVAPEGVIPRAILIAYDDGGYDVLPPSLALGIDGDDAAEKAARTGSIEDLFDHSLQAVFDPAPAELSADPMLRDGYGVLNQRWRDDSREGEAAAFLAEIAKDVAAWDWPLVIARPDAVVAAAAVPLERDDTVGSRIAASVPDDVKRRLLSSLKN
jgi:hypothetical protein